MRLYTIGFTKRSAESFFETLVRHDVKRLVDVRLHNVSQLAGFAKKEDLRYFLAQAGIGYEHRLDLAPTAEMLDAYRKGTRDWAWYEERFNDLIRERQIERISPELVAESSLLCSEATPSRCHRRLVAEYLRDHWGDVEVAHL